MSEYVLTSGHGYIDYDRAWADQRQWLVSDSAANVVSNLLAVLLPIAAQRGLFPILKRMIRLKWSPTHGTVSGPHQARNERLSLGDVVDQSHTAEGLSLRAFASFFLGVTPGRNQLPTVPPGLLWSWDSMRTFAAEAWDNLKHGFEESSDLRWTLLVAVAMALFFFGTIILSVFTAWVVTDTIAVSMHPACNIYVPNSSTGMPASTEGAKYFHDVEVDSAEYARRCYNASDGADGCNFFYQQSIPFTISENTTCPFKYGSDGLCFDGLLSGFTLNTSKVTPEAIGINTPLKYTFQRETTCSPLQMDNRFIRRVEAGNNTTYYQYLYGRQTGNQGGCRPDIDDCTFELILGMVDDQSYSAFITEHNPLLSKPKWHPLWIVNEEDDDVTSLILIQNFGIRYPDRRTEPIFLADTPSPWDGGRWYYNTRWHAGVLGCVDRTTICSPNGTVCGSLRYWAEQGISDTEDFRVLIMLIFSLSTSTMANSISYRGKEALDAQLKTVEGRSLQLVREQWKLEVQELFKTSLARIQINARDIARGPPNGRTEGLRGIMRPEYQGICRMYKFRSTGWRNVSVSGYISACFASLLLMIIALPGEDEELRIEPVLRGLVDLWDHYCRPFLDEYRSKFTSGWKELLGVGRDLWTWCEGF